MFVRELVAVDGVDSSEMMLIDSTGCPTDLAIMSPISKLSRASNAKKLKTTFEAFKVNDFGRKGVAGSNRISRYLVPGVEHCAVSCVNHAVPVFLQASAVQPDLE